MAIRVGTRAQVAPAPAGSAARGVRSAEPIVGDGQRDAGGFTRRVFMAVARARRRAGEHRTPFSARDSRLAGSPAAGGGTPERVSARDSRVAGSPAAGADTPDVLLGARCSARRQSGSGCGHTRCAYRRAMLGSRVGRNTGRADIAG